MGYSFGVSDDWVGIGIVDCVGNSGVYLFRDVLCCGVDDGAVLLRRLSHRLVDFDNDTHAPDCAGSSDSQIS